MFRSPKSEWHDGQRRINDAGKCTRENKAFWTILRSGVRIQTCHAAVWIELAFGQLCVITTQTSWLAQVGSGALIGQCTCWLMLKARESLDSPLAKNDRLHACRRKRQLQYLVMPASKIIVAFFPAYDVCFSFILWSAASFGLPPPPDARYCNEKNPLSLASKHWN